MDSNETKIFIAIIIATLVVFTFIIFFIISIIRYHRISLIKQREKISADLMMLEQERLRLSSDLHDEFGVLISTIKITLHCMDLTTPQNLAYLRQAEELIDQLMQRIRVISADLMPVQLREKGLKQALEDLMENIASSGIVNLNFCCDLPAMALEKKVHIYRLVQEITNNVIKHAAAKKLSVSLTGNTRQVIVEIHDNGKGFDPADVKTGSAGLGLQNIIRRVEVMNGRLYLQTAPGNGTNYLIEIPNN